MVDRKGIIVEGLTDAWRIGPGAVATFGTSFTFNQVRFLSNHLDEAFILFDFGEKEAENKANKLAYQLSSFIRVEILQVKNVVGDPADLNPKEIKYLKKQIFNK